MSKFKAPIRGLVINIKKNESIFIGDTEIVFFGFDMGKSAARIVINGPAKVNRSNNIYPEIRKK